MLMDETTSLAIMNRVAEALLLLAQIPDLPKTTPLLVMPPNDVDANMRIVARSYGMLVTIADLERVNATGLELFRVLTRAKQLAEYGAAPDKMLALINEALEKITADGEQDSSVLALDFSTPADTILHATPHDNVSRET